MKKAISMFMLASIVMLFISGCAKKKTDAAASPAGPTDPQTATAIFTAFSTVFSQIQLAKSDNPSETITINQTITSTSGGSCVVTGSMTTSQTGDGGTWNITLAWNNYRYTDGGTNDYTLSGQMTYTGSVNSTAVTAHFAAPAMTIKGKVAGTSISETISYGFDENVNMTTGHGSLTGNIAGRSFSYTF
ncbi:MAG: hypothetical protein WCO44_00665 [Bacteroidota bacterium]